MENSNTQKKKAPNTLNEKGIKNHKKAAAHLQAAATSHLEAAQHHQDGEHQKAAQSTVSAHGHVPLANKAQKADVKQHAKNG